MNNIEIHPTDRRVKNAVIRKLYNENQYLKGKCIECNPNWDYMEYDNDVQITSLTTTYKGIKYEFKYFSGCFKAYMIGTVIDYSFVRNECNHIILYKNNDVNKINPVATFAGWEVYYNPQIAYERFVKDSN